MTAERWAAAVGGLRPLYEEFGAEPPSRPERFSPTFAEQVEAVLAARPPVFSWVYGIPDSRRARRPARARNRHGRDGDHARRGGRARRGRRRSHRRLGRGGRRAPRRLPRRSPSIRSSGRWRSIPIVADEVAAPVVAAGGIADARGIVAALALGAEGVQIGTAFLATDQSAAPQAHKDALHGPASRRTRLTRAFTGRLARGIPNRMFEAARIEPFPYQAHLIRPLREAALARGRTDVVALWSGQAAPLLRERDADRAAADARSPKPTTCSASRSPHDHALHVPVDRALDRRPRPLDVPGRRPPYGRRVVPHDVRRRDRATLRAGRRPVHPRGPRAGRFDRDPHARRVPRPRRRQRRLLRGRHPSRDRLRLATTCAWPATGRPRSPGS